MQSWGKGERLDQGKHWKLKGQRTDLDISGGKVYYFFLLLLPLPLSATLASSLFLTHQAQSRLMTVLIAQTALPLGYHGSLPWILPGFA